MRTCLRAFVCEHFHKDIRKQNCKYFSKDTTTSAKTPCATHVSQCDDFYGEGFVTMFFAKVFAKLFAIDHLTNRQLANTCK